ncbi:pH nine-sensitive protein 1 [Thecaphora frezii]|nr:putative choline transporter-like protein 2 [Thecaphora frezii]
MSQTYSYGQPPPPPQGGYYPPSSQPPPGGAYYPPPPQMNQPSSYAPAHAPGGYQGQPDGAQNNYYQQDHQPPLPHTAYHGYDAKMPLKPEGFEGQRLEPKPKWNDVPFLILFLCVFGGFIAISVISLRAYATSGVNETIGRGNVAGSTLNGHTAVMWLLCCGIALVLSAVYLFLVRTFTTFILEATLLLTTLANVAYAVYLWVRGSTSAAIIFTVFAVLSVIAYFFMRSRIPFAKILLRAIIRAADQYKSAYVVALSGLVVQTAFSAWVSYTIVAMYQRFEPSGSASGSSASNGTVIGLFVFIAIAYYWISEVIKNVAFTTVAGIFGTWYYNATKPGRVAWGAFRRTATYSLGSICFGSLIVALLDLLRAFFNMIQSQQAAEGDLVGTILACVASCCVACIQGLVEYFNRYAYINIALYGNNYIKAAKETWALLADRGIDALVNDSLVNIVFSCGAFIIGLLTSLFAFIYEQKTNPSYLQQDSGYYSIVLLVSFALGLNIAMAVGSGSIASGVSTFFVALAEDPQVLAQRDPELFEAIRSRYPHVVNPVS